MTSCTNDLIQDLVNRPGPGIWFRIWILDLILDMVHRSVQDLVNRPGLDLVDRPGSRRGLHICFRTWFTNLVQDLVHRHTSGPSSQTCIRTFNIFTLRVPVVSSVCYSHTFGNNLGLKGKFTEYLKESFNMASDQHFFFKCFLQNAFVSKIFPKLSGLFWPL